MATPLHVSVKNTLLQRIREGTYPPGQRLPTQEEFAREFGVAFGTVAKAIKELRAEGLIDARPRAGMRVRPPADCRNGTLAFLVCEVSTSSVYRNMFFDICEHLRDFNLESTVIPALQRREGGFADFLPARNLASRAFVGIITMNVMDITYLAQLKQLTPPVIVLDRDTREVGLDCVIFDNLGAGFAMTNRLLETGHQAVGFLCMRPPSGREGQRDYDPASNERFHGYRLALETAGMHPRNAWVQYAAGHGDPHWEEAAERLLTAAPECTALVTEGGIQARDGGVWRALRRHGRDLAVAGWKAWGAREDSYLDRLALYTDFDLARMAAETAALFRRRAGKFEAQPEQIILRGAYSWK